MLRASAQANPVGHDARNAIGSWLLAFEVLDQVERIAAGEGLDAGYRRRFDRAPGQEISPLFVQHAK